MYKLATLIFIFIFFSLSFGAVAQSQTNLTVDPTQGMCYSLSSPPPPLPAFTLCSLSMILLSPPIWPCQYFYVGMNMQAHVLDVIIILYVYRLG